MEAAVDFPSAAAAAVAAVADSEKASQRREKQKVVEKESVLGELSVIGT